MQIIIDVITVILRLLITLGDCVLLLLRLITRFLHAVKKLLLSSANAVKHISITLLRGMGKIVLLPFGLLKHMSQIRIAPRKKSVKHAKPIVIFPLPFIIKLRYFTAGMFVSFFLVFLPLLFLIFLQELPNPRELSLSQLPQTTKIYDRNGTILYQIYADQNRTLVPLEEVPDYLRQATIAIEDKDFYKHPGFDITAIIRSATQNFAGKPLQGGSTITQQLIKSTLLTSETTLIRKTKEVILAFWAERMYTKNQILEMYFNQVPYGGTAWGVEAAAGVYFGKHIQDLDLAESAFLAGIPKAPTIYSPFGLTPTLWKQRQIDVLNRMTELGYISKEQAQQAKNEELSFQSPQTPIRAPHFVLYIKDMLVKKYGLPMVEKGGLSVVTSLDLTTQDKAQTIVQEEVTNNEYLHLTNGAAVVTDPRNGDIIAMVGSRDYYDANGGNVNIATALRQPGSSIKIVTYAAALSKGFTPATILDDSPTTFPGNPPYSPVNYDGRFHGKIPLRLAFANSFNIPAVKTLNQIGIPAMVNLGKAMGVKSWGEPEKYGLSITLGGAEVTMLDMASVFGTVANFGKRVDINPLLKVTDGKGNILEEKTVQKTRVLSDGVAFIISHILADNQARAWEFGTNSPLVIADRTVSVKTGTSDNKRDNWTIGYTPSTLVAVWVGNNDNSPMSQNLASGITGAAPIWNRIMSGLLAGKPNEQFSPPSVIVQKQCFGKNEYFVRGTENAPGCNAFALPLLTPSPQP